MSDTPATDLLLGTLARNLFLAGFKYGSGETGWIGGSEAAWNDYEPTEEDKVSVHELDDLLVRSSYHPDTAEVLAAMGDRSVRDTAHLMDICIAGTIDATIGYGEVVIKPIRVEELVPLIAKRRQDPDGNWRLRLLPPDHREAKVNPADVLAYTLELKAHTGEDEIDPADLLDFVIAAAKPGVTLHDLGMQGHAMFVEWVDERHAVDN